MITQKLDDVVEKVIIYLSRNNNLTEAKALILNWERQGYDVSIVKKVYWTYELTYNNKTTEL